MNSEKKEGLDMLTPAPTPPLNEHNTTANTTSQPPFEDLYELLEELACMLYWVERQTSKKSAINKLNTAAAFSRRIYALIPRFERRQGASLEEIKRPIRRVALSLTFLEPDSLKDARQHAQDVTKEIEEIQRKLDALIGGWHEHTN